MTSITPKKLLKFLEDKGFYVSRQSGSHVIFHTNMDKNKRVTIPFHSKDLKQGTLNSILKQAGVEKKDLFR